METKSGVKIIMAIAEAVRASGAIPAGHIYALVCDRLSLEAFARVLDTLKAAKLVEETPAHLLKWVGPTLVESEVGK